MPGALECAPALSHPRDEKLGTGRWTRAPPRGATLSTSSPPRARKNIPEKAPRQNEWDVPVEGRMLSVYMGMRVAQDAWQGIPTALPPPVTNKNNQFLNLKQ